MDRRPSGLAPALAAAAVLGAVSALGDWIWARFIPDGAVLPGILHGLAIFTVLALVLGRATGVAGASRRLLLTLPAAGVVIAAGFYPLAHGFGYVPALLLSWGAMWLALAFLLRRAGGGGESRRRALSRGLLAAVASGLGFWAISGIWTRPDPDPDYLLRAAYWAFAFLPGFVALLWRTPPADR